MRDFLFVNVFVAMLRVFCACLSVCQCVCLICRIVACCSVACGSCAWLVACHCVCLACFVVFACLLRVRSLPLWCACVLENRLRGSHLVV